MRARHAVLAVFYLAISALGAMAQGTSLAFGQTGFNDKEPIEIVSDSIEMNQSDGRVVFQGNVVVAQGSLRLSAGRIDVIYGEDRTKIDSLTASGGVTVVTNGEAAEAKNAVYSVTNRLIEMRGDVLVSQGPTALSGDLMTIDLERGNAKMEGRVKTILNPGTVE